METKDMAGQFSDKLPELYAAFAQRIEGKFETIMNRIDRLGENCATKADLEKVSLEMKTSYVRSDTYEARHAVLIDNERRLELRIDKVEQQSLSDKERGWLRFTQVISFGSLILAAIDFFVNHVHLN